MTYFKMDIQFLIDSKYTLQSVILKTLASMMMDSHAQCKVAECVE